MKAFTSSLIVFETLARARGLGMWPGILARNHWFQRKVVNALTSLAAGASAEAADFGHLTSDSPVLLSYSYTALEPFRYAKSRGWKTVLAQIDPGLEEQKIVAAEVGRVPGLAARWQPAPPEYWHRWREECKLADRIVVNSEWSREGLVRAEVPSEKITVIPLAYESPEVGSQKSAAFAQAPAAREVGAARLYPDRFTQDRPLRVLFLGLINLRKGVARLLEAARILRDEPVEFWIVGPVEIANTNTIGDAGRRRFPQGNGYRVKWFGRATRKQATEFYRNADVFLLPTLSDGFAITQLEAQAHGLPIIVSKTCGKVVENGINGIILEEPTAACIAHAVHECIASPARLATLGAASQLADKFTLQALAQRVEQLGATL